MSNQLLWPELAVKSAQPEPVSGKADGTDYPAQAALSQIQRLDLRLHSRFSTRLILQPALTRSLVSFQASKDKAEYRWYKFKEAFSAPLIEYLLHRYEVKSGLILDPFAGSGTALFAATANGLNADGIEVLPVGQTLIKARNQCHEKLRESDLQKLHQWAEHSPWTTVESQTVLPELRITRGAYSPETKAGIEKYLAAVQQEQEPVRSLLLYALLGVLEAVSYTRKDGQYLRWDYRSGRNPGGKQFDKGKIADFNQAVSDKIGQIITDLKGQNSLATMFQETPPRGQLNLYAGSCLNILPTLPDAFYDAVITSPPYCNRYDYTRTYALELALLGIGEEEMIRLRQQMLSCTVENREKDLLQINPAWDVALSATDRQELLQTILKYLERQKAQGLLNNTGIPRMVRGYFYEMACVIAECARVMKPGAPLLMVNDNVRYAGASVSVDLILSDIAEQLGFSTENILVLPNGKGNSSQQMGEHGREVLRKCVYVWRKR